MKAGLSEIFAAMNGIVFAGVSLSLDGHDTKEHPIADLAVRAAMLSYDVRETLMVVGPTAKIQPSRETVEQAAGKLVAFMEASLPLLETYPQVVLQESSRKRIGGTLGDVRAHIGDILHRESALAASDRSYDHIKADGDVLKAFAVKYLPTKAARKYPEGMEAPSEGAGKLRGMKNIAQFSVA